MGWCAAPGRGGITLYCLRDSLLARHVTVLVYAVIASAIRCEDECAPLVVLTPPPLLAIPTNILHYAMSVFLPLLPQPFVATPVIILEYASSVPLALVPLPFVATPTNILHAALSVPLALQPLPVIGLKITFNPGRPAEPVTLSSPHIPSVCECRVSVSSRERTQRHPLHTSNRWFVHATLHLSISCLGCCAFYLRYCTLCLRSCTLCLRYYTFCFRCYTLCLRCYTLRLRCCTL
jgi:hypothetical protein